MTKSHDTLEPSYTLLACLVEKELDERDAGRGNMTDFCLDHLLSALQERCPEHPLVQRALRGQ